jgi:hypothetical protein
MNLQIHDFGIYLELEPEDEDKAALEQSIQIALQTQSIALSDAIDIRQIKNIKLANQYLKIRQNQKIKRDQEQQEKNIAAQAQANGEAAERAATADMQKNQSANQDKAELEKLKTQLDISKLEAEARIKMQLMEKEFEMNLKLAEMNSQNEISKIKSTEDRKDARVKMTGTQQSEMIEQRKRDSAPKNFESAGMDNLDGFGLEQFNPR